MAWETIVEEWRGSISKDAIAEAVRLARPRGERVLKSCHEYRTLGFRFVVYRARRFSRDSRSCPLGGANKKVPPGFR